MSVISGPNIVMDGLIFHADAGNTKSYSGSGTTWTDLSGNSRHITLINSPTFNSNSVLFNGSNHHSESIIFTPNITSKTTMAWCKLTSISQTAGGLIGIMGSGGEPFDSIVYNETSNGWGFGSTGFTRTAWSGVKETSTSAWVHLAATYSNLNYNLYRNGVNILTTTLYNALNYNFASKIIMGKRHGSLTGPLGAYISQGMVYSRALSSAEVLQNYNSLKSRYNL